MKLVLDYDSAAVSIVAELKSPEDISKAMDSLIDAGRAMFGWDQMDQIFAAAEGDDGEPQTVN